MRKNHRELSLQLLRVMRRVDLLEGRFASAMGFWSSQQKGAAAELARQLSHLEAQVAPGASGGIIQDFHKSGHTLTSLHDCIYYYANTARLSHPLPKPYGVG